MAKVWDADSGDPVLNLNRHQDEVTCVAFSTDGSRVLTGSGDQTAIVWLADAISPTIVVSEETQTLPAAGESVIVDDQAILLDPDATHFDGAQLTIRVTATADAPQEGSPPDVLLEIRPTPQIQVVDGELQYRADNENEAAVTIGSVNVDPPTPGQLQIQLTELANRAAVQSLLRSVAAKPRSDIDASIAVQFQLTTGDGLSSHLAERKLEPDATASDDDQLVAGQ
jgi:hypothetical protein